MRHWTSVWGSNNWRFSWTNFLFYMKVFTCDLCRGTRAYCTSCSVCLYICMHLRFCLSVCVCVCMCDTYAHINLHVSAWWLMWQSGYNLYYIVLPFYKGRGRGVWRGRSNSNGFKFPGAQAGFRGHVGMALNTGHDPLRGWLPRRVSDVSLLWSILVCGLAITMPRQLVDMPQEGKVRWAPTSAQAPARHRSTRNTTWVYNCFCCCLRFGLSKPSHVFSLIVYSLITSS